jgi:S-adenosylmethionine:tRNA ribosyltransferase-isomerase
VKTADFDYALPPQMIAQTPIEPRDASRLLILERSSGATVHRHFHDLPEYLRAGDLLVCNDSQVIPARLYGRKLPGGGQVELLLLHRRDERVWEVIVGGKRIRKGTEIEIKGGGERLTAQVIEEGERNRRLVAFDRPLEALLDKVGITPLPPYIHKPLADPARYQTVYARVAGSAAAPTAGMHFTPRLIAELLGRGVLFAFVTLHIGLDTFQPVQTEEVKDHRMHSEYCELPVETSEMVKRARAEGRRVIAVGTTAVRVLESAAGRGEELRPFQGWSELFIYPGFEFRLVDALITNFHLPRSTLLMLVSAFAGTELIRRAYAEAIRHGYRFYSFGDAMLIL